MNFMKWFPNFHIFLHHYYCADFITFNIILSYAVVFVNFWDEYILTWFCLLYFLIFCLINYLKMLSYFFPIVSFCQVYFLVIFIQRIYSFLIYFPTFFTHQVALTLISSRNVILSYYTFLPFWTIPSSLWKISKFCVYSISFQILPLSTWIIEIFINLFKVI